MKKKKREKLPLPTAIILFFSTIIIIIYHLELELCEIVFFQRQFLMSGHFFFSLQQNAFK